MGLLIGMDEAGYGPNLGPLVITATVWEVPGDPRTCDPWQLLGDLVARDPRPGDDRLHVADSKQVYAPQRGIGALERGALALFDDGSGAPASLFALWDRAVGPRAEEARRERSAEPWFAGSDLPLPLAVSNRAAATGSERLARAARAGVRLRAVRSEVVLTSRFNRLVRESDSKGLALSRLSLRLLREAWDPDGPEQTLVVADKHGGRNRYAALLSEVLDDRPVLAREESRERSTYRTGRTEITFRTGGEAHLPVAWASLVSKYLREAALELFNRFWQSEVPGLAPTKGYPEDAKRFKSDIAAAQTRLGLPDDALWRAR